MVERNLLRYKRATHGSFYDPGVVFSEKAPR